MINGRVLVTGGGGFIGSYVVRQLTANACRVRVLELPEVNLDHLPARGIEVVRASICDFTAVRNAAEDCTAVLHLAANPNLWARDPHTFEQVNHQGTRNVLKAAAEAGASRTVYVSTESILTRKDTGDGPHVIDQHTQPRLSDQPGAYCRSKYLAECAAREAAEAGQPVVIVRPTVPVGRGDKHRGPFTRMLADYAAGRFGAFYLPGRVNLVDVQDAAAGIVAAAERGRVGQTYLLAGKDWDLADLFAYLSELTGQPAPKFKVPYAAAWTFAWLEEHYYRYLSRSGQPSATLAGVQLARRSFEFRPEHSLEELNIKARDTRLSIREALEDLGVPLRNDVSEGSDSSTANLGPPARKATGISADRRPES